MGASRGDDITVLLVDDEAELVSIIGAYLEQENDQLAVRTATSAGEGRAVLEEWTVDCVVSDYDMPGETGLDFLETVREEHPDLPFILYTGKGSESVASEAINAGVTDYFLKGSGTDQYARLANRVANAVESHRAEQRRAAAEARYRRLFDGMNEGAILCELRRDEAGEPVDFEILEANDAFEDVLDASKTAVEGELVSDLLGRTAPPELDRLAAVAETGEPTQFETAVAELDRHLHVSAFSPRPGQFAALFTDVSDRIEREQDLERFEKATEYAGHAIYVTDPDGQIEYVNPAFEEMTGYDREAALGANPRILKSGEMDQSYYEDLWETILAGETWEEEIVNRKRDGELYHAHQTIAPIFDETGDIEEFVAIQTDVSEQKSHEQELELFKQLIDESNALVFVADPETGDITYANRSAAEQLGYTRAELLSKQVQDIEAAFDSYEEWAAHLETVREQGRLRFEGRHVKRDGETIPVEVNLTTVELDDEYVVAIARDVSARLEHERELELQNERLDEFASMVSHDLRNPLNVAQGRIELARETGGSEHLGAAENAIERSLDLIEDMLSLARAGKRVKKREPVDLTELTADCWDHVATGDATLSAEAEGRIRADRSRLEQLLENLVRNAVEHGGADVTITVGTLPDGFYVEDDGPGLEESVADNVFEAGYSTRQDGTGFGLSIVEEIAGAHDWDVRVTDGTDGGARFEITGVEWT